MRTARVAADIELSAINSRSPPATPKSGSRDRIRKIGSLRQNSDSQTFEVERGLQAKDWSEQRIFFAAKTNLVHVLRRAEEKFAPEERVKHYISQRDHVGATVLHISILCESWDVAKYLITTYGRELVREPYTVAGQPSMYEGETALHVAIVKVNPAIVKLLVQHGADINAETTGDFFDQDEKVDKGVYFGSTPLMFAVCSGQVGIAEYLLNKGADPSIKDRYGNTALHLAVWYELPEMYDLLISRDHGFGGDLKSLTNKLGLTPLKLAARRASITMFRHILKRTREPNWKFGPVREYLYPINELDSYKEDKNDKNSTSCLELLVESGTLLHAKMLQEQPFLDLLTEKWSRFARQMYLMNLFVYAMAIGFMTAALVMTPEDPNDYGGLFGRIRMALEIVVIVVVLIFDPIAFELPGWMSRSIEMRGFLRYHAGSIIFAVEAWVFRGVLLTTLLLRVFGAQESIQRTFMSFLAVLGWLYMLNFARAVPATGRFILLTERMALEMVQWLVVFLAELLAFAVAFQLLYEFPRQPIDSDSTATTELDYVPRALFTLLKWTLGEFNFDTVDAEASKSPGAVYVLFAGFVILTTTILFTILIALMTTTYTLYDDESGTYALLQYANTILTYERSAAFYGFGKRLRSGTPGHSCGMLADIYYKPVLIKQTSGRDLNKDGIIGNDNEDAFQDLENLYGTKRVPGYPSAYYASQPRAWETLMSKIQSDAKNGNYIEDFAELDDLFRLYDVYKTQSVNRETAAHMMQDLCFNNALDATGDIVAQVKDASRAVASMLDPDKDDDIPLETLATFCRLSRMQLLHDSQHGSKPFKFALIVVDVQNDFINGPMPVQRWSSSIITKINSLREQADLVIFTKDWHPENHSSFATSSFEKEMSMRRASAHGIRTSAHPTAVRRTASTSQSSMHVIHASDVDDQVWPRHCVQDEEGAELHSDLDVHSNDVIVLKGTHVDVDSYSAFWDNERKNQTELFQVLFDNDVQDVFVCGLGYDCAVGRTARDAAAYGFVTYVVEDACCSFDDGWEGEMHLELETAGVKRTTMAAVPGLRRRDETNNLTSNTIKERTQLTRVISRARPSHMYAADAQETSEKGKGSRAPESTI